MNLTDEQQHIINSSGNIKINAVAGSGKTTTILEYIKTRAKSSKILYLAYNKSVKEEAKAKLIKHGINNVDVHTAHSLAYQNQKMQEAILKSYSPFELPKLLNIESNKNKIIDKYLIAHYTLKLIDYFYNSNVEKIEDLDLIKIIFENESINFVKEYYDYIYYLADLFYQLMKDGGIQITHDFYLKQYQLNKPKLNYDFICFDEGQDASPVIWDIVNNQKATKIITGDVNQQIYSWRFAVNMLQNIGFKQFYLTQSFRFNQDIADLAVRIINWKKYINQDYKISVIGSGNSKSTKVKALIARTNLEMIDNALEFSRKSSKDTRIYFEGGNNNAFFLEENSLFNDIQNLYANKKHLIKSNFISSFSSFDELANYNKKATDTNLSNYTELVKKYGENLNEILTFLKEKSIPDISHKKDASMIFTTLHKAKGMEYDSVELANDFIKESDVKDIHKRKNVNFAKINEEINILYVAVTRTKNRLKFLKSHIKNEEERTQISNNQESSEKADFQIEKKIRSISLPISNPKVVVKFDEFQKLLQQKPYAKMYQEGSIVFNAIAKYGAKNKNIIEIIKKIYNSL